MIWEFDYDPSMLSFQIILIGSLVHLVSGSFRARMTRIPGEGQISRQLTETTSIKDAMEAMGIPHCEIGSIFRRSPASPSTSPPMEDQVRDGDILEIRPWPPRGLEDPCFLCDGHLGKLAKLLRILGFDTLWDQTWTESGVARRGVNEDRVVLSGCRALLKRRELDRAQLIRSDDPDTQLAEVLRRWQVAEKARPWGRCSRCNGILRPVPKAEVASRIPPRTARWLDEYHLCGDCNQLFWKGTHFMALNDRLVEILADSRDGGKFNGTGAE